MKHILLLTFAIFFIADTFCQLPNFANENIQKNIIKSNKIFKEVVYNYSFNNDDIEDSVLTSTLIYDASGNVVEVILPNRKKGIVKYNFNYNSLGNLVKQTGYDNNSKIVATTEYDYDNLGNKIIEYWHNKDITSMTVEKYVYNENNQVIESTTNMNNDIFDTVRHYFYNQDNNELIKEDVMIKKGAVEKQSGSYFYVYNASLNKKLVYYKSQSDERIVAEYFYNNDHQCIEIDSCIRSPYFSNNSTSYINYNPDIGSLYGSSMNQFAQINLQVVGDKLLQSNTLVILPENPIYPQGGVKTNNVFDFSNNSNINYSGIWRLDEISEVNQSIYNPDKTLFETTIFQNGKKVQMIRHYYFKH